jgi:ATP synthase protein I
MNNIIGFSIEIGTTVALTTIGGILLGRFLDSRFGWTPFGLVLGVFIGIGLATTVLVIRAQRLLK